MSNITNYECIEKTKSIKTSPHINRVSFDLTGQHIFAVCQS
jgi:hypothetical protein